MAVYKILKRFRVYVEGGRLYFLVLVFNNRAAMQDAIRRVCKIKVDPRTEAQTTGWDVYSYAGKVKRLKPNMGIIFLHTNKLGSTTISHECLHAAARYIGRKHGRHMHNFNSINGRASENEEDLAYAIGNIMGNIVHRLNMYKLFKPKNQPI